MLQNRQLKLLCHVLRHPEEEAHNLTFTAELSLKREAKLRIGGPRKNWVKENIKELWARFGNECNQFTNTPEQRNKLLEYAERFKGREIIVEDGGELELEEAGVGVFEGGELEVG
eukprot:1866903-Alexandrium_andersonii.AAC.1